MFCNTISSKKEPKKLVRIKITLSNLGQNKLGNSHFDSGRVVGVEPPHSPWAGASGSCGGSRRRLALSDGSAAAAASPRRSRRGLRRSTDRGCTCSGSGLKAKLKKIRKQLILMNYNGRGIIMLSSYYRKVKIKKEDNFKTQKQRVE
jgi:hypothetical protein